MTFICENDVKRGNETNNFPKQKKTFAIKSDSINY